METRIVTMIKNHKRKLTVALDSNVFDIVLIMLLAVGLRALPEFLSGSYPVGFDTTQGYIPSILALPNNSPMRCFGWAYSPLVIYLLALIYQIIGIDPNLLMKIAGPFFYGLLGASFYYMLSRGLQWKNKVVLFVAALFILQPSILRTGWDQLREELALVFFFVLLARTQFILLNRTNAKLCLVSALSILIVLSHQLISVLLFVVLIWQLIAAGINKEGVSIKSVAVFVPAMAIFGWQLYSQFINPSYSQRFMPLILPNGTGNFIFTNYFLNDPRFLNGNYFTVVFYVVSLAAFTFVPLIPFSLKGFFKDRVFTPITCWLIISSFSILVYPAYSFSQYWWWMLLLPISMTIYVGNFLNKIKLFETKRRFRTATSALAILTLVSVAYATSTFALGNSYSFSYSPSGLVQSSIPIRDISDVENALRWANENFQPNATVIVQEKTQGFCYLVLRSDLQIRVSPSLLTLDQAINLTRLKSGMEYAIWTTNNVDKTNSDTIKIMDFESVAVFQICR
jgi:hypothetical protein